MHIDFFILDCARCATDINSDAIERLRRIQQWTPINKIGVFKRFILQTVAN